MIIGKVNSPISDVFTVFDINDELVPHIPLSEFNVTLIGPNNFNMVLESSVKFSEIGSGNYRVTFTPTIEGLYHLVVYHSTYFPKGKAGSFQIFTSDFSSLYEIVQYIADFQEGRWRLDQTTKQMIFYKGDNITEIARFNLFDSSGNPSVANLFERVKV